MLLLVLVPILLAFIYLVVKFVQSSKPEGFARGIAKAQLISLDALKSSSESMPKEVLYYKAIKTRPGYTEKEVKSIVKGAKMACRKSKLPFNFRAVVIQLVAYEYMKRTSNSPISVMDEINKGVISVIGNEV